MLVPNSVTLAVGIVATSTANRILAGTTANNRFIRGMTVTNTTTSPIDLSVGIGVAATLSAANADVANAVTIPAKAASYPLVQYTGQGRKALAAGTLNEIMAFASLAGLFLTVVYSDDV